ncbi:MAG TPA: PQQ-binding-like beta-propeller repeat protein [Candidatus Angelobacter sp.]|nr:PQQ-binding-like beta-propeller repeat protein [Candidatus Angelobacter sp.]
MHHNALPRRGAPRAVRAAAALAAALGIPATAALAAQPVAAPAPPAAGATPAAAAALHAATASGAPQKGAATPQRATTGASTSTTATAPSSIEDGPALPCDHDTPAPGGTWPSYGHDPYNSRTQSAETTIGTANAAGLAPAWTFALASAGDSGQLQSTPLATDGCVFFTATNGGVYALNARTGALVWRHVTPVVTPGLGGGIVGGAAVRDGRVYALINETGDAATHGPYAIALDEHTGHLLWTSKPISTGSGYYTNATPQVIGDSVFAGFSPPEGDPTGQGGFALIDTESGQIVKLTTTITPAHQAQGFAGGGIWSTPAWDARSGFAYVGAGNPYSKDREDEHTNAILEIDMREESASFGQIVAAYKGNVDQYTQTLQAASQTPVCSASATAPDPLDDPACGQLDLDFGAAPNLFTAGGHLVVGELQKSGVYHVADAHSMAPVWNTIVGATCQACNAASTAVDGSTVVGEATPGGALFGLDRGTGNRSWVSPVADGVHYESFSIANGVAYTVDTLGCFDAWNTATGQPLLHRPMVLDTQFPNAALTSSGVAIAYHTIYAAASTGASTAGSAQQGYVVAYRTP